MGDTFFNIIIIVAVVIVIGRTIFQMKKKPEPPPRIPVHFEDDGEPVSLKSKVPAAVPKAVPKKVLAPKTIPLSQFESKPLGQFRNSKVPEIPSSKPAVRIPAAAPQGQTGFPFNLNNLSPMKQAIVLAEILGPPKGMRDM